MNEKEKILADKQKKEEKLLSEMEDRCRLSFELRGKMALIQEKEYLNNKSNFTLDKIKEKISEWIKDNREFIKVKEPIKFEMKKLLLDKEQMQKYMDKKQEEILELVGEPDPFNYLYVTHRADGMVVAVGKSSSKKDFLGGDLFYQLNTNRLSGTENIILRVKYGNHIFSEYDEFLKDYLDISWIIPIEQGNSKQLERSLGDELIRQKVPILNYYSHRQ